MVGTRNGRGDDGWRRRRVNEIEDEMRSRRLLDVVIRQCTTILELFAAKIRRW
jgi:hypothetical protein